MEALDSIDDCGKLYLCQLAATEKAGWSQEERKLIEALHQDGQVKVESAESAFQMAVQLGLQYKSQSKCNTRYARCLLWNRRQRSLRRSKKRLTFVCLVAQRKIALFTPLFQFIFHLSLTFDAAGFGLRMVTKSRGKLFQHRFSGLDWSGGDEDIANNGSILHAKRPADFLCKNNMLVISVLLRTQMVVNSARCRDEITW